MKKKKDRTGIYSQKKAGIKAMQNKPKIHKMITGGQTGVDQGALDFALENELPCGGWSPKGRIAENGVIPLIYPVEECDSDIYDVRTELNVQTGDGTLIITLENDIGEGTKYTIDMCRKHEKPFIILEMNDNITTICERFDIWLNKHDIQILNIAGSRESSSPGIQGKTKEFLGKLFDK